MTTSDQGERKAAARRDYTDLPTSIIGAKLAADLLGKAPAHLSG